MMDKELPLYAYSVVRSLGFAAEFYVLNSLERLLPKRFFPKSRGKYPADWPTLLAVRDDLHDLLRHDAARIGQGVYPASVLIPESPVQHLKRLPKLVLDAISITWRRNRGKTTEFDAAAKELLSDLPPYYRRNFHFQTSGYLSERSAEVYEHQVELLFKGGADAMRRLILPALREHFGKGGGDGLRILEIGAGTGRATRFVRQTFPKAKITASDLSDPYLKLAQRRLSGFSRIDFVQADGARLPFKSGEFDAVYSVFLFHELPMEARREILAESGRVLKPGGFIGLVDSLQTGDKKLFDPFLLEFPKEFHEPYYRDYIAHPMEELLEKVCGASDVRTELGFSSKLCWGIMPNSTS